MSIKVCPNGHHYNTDDNSECPICAQSKSKSSFDWTAADLSDDTSAMGGWNRKTENDEGFWHSYYSFIPDTDLGANDADPGPATEEYRNEYQQQPVVGWLVCIDGPDKGKDFCLHGAKSAIGRRMESAVRLTDLKISREGYPALIVYDDRKTHRFYLASGDASSHNNVELDGNMLLGQILLNPYAEIRIEDTVLVFIPFCGEDFHWKEK